MLAWLYPPVERGLFVGRQDLLAQLDAAAESLLRGQPLHLALFSPRRRGKSLLLKEHFARLRQRRRCAAVYLNLEPMASTARIFATQYVGWLVYWLFAPDDAWPDDYLTWAGLRQAEVPQAVHRLLLQLSGQFDSPATPPAHLLELAFRLPERLAALIGRPIVVILDEFQSLRQLDGHRKLGHTLALFRPVLTS
ncbi:MAG: ATP-binding protein, partial [Chloroflexi bacterium]|nr:ATP-binding protein [Chloroflexota bacterium]